MMNGYANPFRQDRSWRAGLTFDAENNNAGAAQDVAGGLGDFGFDMSGVTTDGVTGANLQNFAGAFAQAIADKGITSVDFHGIIQPINIIAPMVIIHPFWDTPWDWTGLTLGKIISDLLQFGDQRQRDALHHGMIGVYMRDTQTNQSSYIEFSFSAEMTPIDVTGAVNPELNGITIDVTTATLSAPITTDVPDWLVSQLNAYTDANGNIVPISRPNPRVMDGPCTNTRGVIMMEQDQISALIITGVGKMTPDKMWWIDGIYSRTTGARLVPPADCWPTPLGLGTVGTIPATGNPITGPFLLGAASGNTILQGVSGGGAFVDPIDTIDRTTGADFVAAGAWTICGVLGGNDVVMSWKWNDYINNLPTTPGGSVPTAGEQGGAGPA